MSDMHGLFARLVILCSFVNPSFAEPATQDESIQGLLAEQTQESPTDKSITTPPTGVSTQSAIDDPVTDGQRQKTPASGTENILVRSSNLDETGTDSQVDRPDRTRRESEAIDWSGSSGYQALEHSPESVRLYVSGSRLVLKETVNTTDSARDTEHRAWPIKVFKGMLDRMRARNQTRDPHPDEWMWMTDYERETGRNWAGGYRPRW